MTIESRFKQLRAQRAKEGLPTVPPSPGGVQRAQVEDFVRQCFNGNVDITDAICALLDDTTPSGFTSGRRGQTRTWLMSEGATTAQIGAYIGILKRGGELKLDREGRDHWIKPLRAIGGINPVTFDRAGARMLQGHPHPKSPNSAYRLDESFCRLLNGPPQTWEKRLYDWLSEDARRRRAQVQAEAVAATLMVTGSAHQRLIDQCREVYAPKLLPDWNILFVDDADGDRISQQERAQLLVAGVDLQLGDAMPDLLLHRPDSDEFWVIEAVTSDGEVDAHKVAQMTAALRRSRPTATVMFTTAYPDWATAARRQGAHRNIEAGTFVWIAADPGVHWSVHRI
jgi:hypothetical protein